MFSLLLRNRKFFFLDLNTHLLASDDHQFMWLDGTYLNDLHDDHKQLYMEKELNILWIISLYSPFYCLVLCVLCLYSLRHKYMTHAKNEKLIYQFIFSCMLLFLSNKKLLRVIFFHNWALGFLWSYVLLLQVCILRFWFTFCLVTVCCLSCRLKEVQERRMQYMKILYLFSQMMKLQVTKYLLSGELHHKFLSLQK